MVFDDSTNEEPVSNGMSLSPTHDALAHPKLISFENKRKIIFPGFLSTTKYYDRGVPGKEIIKDL